MVRLLKCDSMIYPFCHSGKSGDPQWREAQGKAGVPTRPVLPNGHTEIERFPPGEWQCPWTFGDRHSGIFFFSVKHLSYTESVFLPVL